MHHIYVNHIIEPTPEGAKGQVNMLMIGSGGDKNKIENDAYYEDMYGRDTGRCFRRCVAVAAVQAAAVSTRIRR